MKEPEKETLDLDPVVRVLDWIFLIAANLCFGWFGLLAWSCLDAAIGAKILITTISALFMCLSYKMMFGKETTESVLEKNPKPHILTVIVGYGLLGFLISQSTTGFIAGLFSDDAEKTLCCLLLTIVLGLIIKFVDHVNHME